MKNLAYTWWKDESQYIGFLNSYPDYETQGESVSELEENLRDIYIWTFRPKIYRIYGMFLN